VKQRLVALSPKNAAVISNISIPNAYVENVFYDARNKTLVALAIVNNQWVVGVLDVKKGTLSNVFQTNFLRKDFEVTGSSFNYQLRIVTINLVSEMVSINVDYGSISPFIPSGKMPQQHTLSSFAFLS